MFDMFFDDNLFDQRRILGERIKKACLVLLIIATIWVAWDKGIFDSLVFKIFAVSALGLIILRSQYHIK